MTLGTWRIFRVSLLMGKEKLLLQLLINCVIGVLQLMNG